MLSLRPLGYVAVLSVVSVGCGGTGEGFKETEAATSPLPRSTSSSATLTCKKAGCSDRFTVRLKQRPSDPKGWAVEVDLKGQLATCTFDWSPTTTSATCGEGLSMAFHEPPLDDATTATLTSRGRRRAWASPSSTTVHLSNRSPSTILRTRRTQPALLAAAKPQGRSCSSSASCCADKPCAPRGLLHPTARCWSSATPTREPNAVRG